MAEFPDLPDVPHERAMLLQNMLITQATGGGTEVDDGLYRRLRAEFMGNCTARGWWDTGLEPTRPGPRVKAAPP